MTPTIASRMPVSVTHRKPIPRLITVTPLFTRGLMLFIFPGSCEGCEVATCVAWRLSETRVVELHELRRARPQAALGFGLQRGFRRIDAPVPLVQPAARALESGRGGELGEVLGRTIR